MSLLPSPPRPRTLFEAIRDLSDHQTENHVLLTQVVATQATTATNQSTLHATLGQVQAQIATTVGISVGALSLHVSMLISRHTAPTPADFSLAFVVVGLLTTMAAPIALGMPRNAGDDLTGRRSA